VALTAAGYYTYRESIAATEAYDAVVTACGEASETTLAKAVPQVETVVSSAVVRSGAELSDTLKVTGLGKTPATIDVELFGPYASRADIDCAGAPYWKGTVQAAAGDGTYSSPQAAVRRVGFYVFREKVAGSETVAAHEAECLLEAETSLAAPAILGGRGDHVAYVAQGGGGPSKVKLGRLGIDAPVSAIGIDLKSGALGIPENIKRVGWWRDGAMPGDEQGTALIAGHVDSAKSGAGAFYALKSARRGDTVTVIQGAKTLRYRVTAIRTMRKAALPTSIYTRTGSPKLVLVTCGGPFDAKSGHYRDNVVVTAVPI
jgi:LPXTG-site transpeptidase (sortase) family protein